MEMYACLTETAGLYFLKIRKPIILVIVEDIKLPDEISSVDFLAGITVIQFWPAAKYQSICYLQKEGYSNEFFKMERNQH